MDIYIFTMHLLFHETFHKSCVKTKIHKNKIYSIALCHYVGMLIFTYLHNVDITMNVSCQCPHPEDNFSTTQSWIGSDVHSADQYKRKNVFQIVLVKNLDINYQRYHSQYSSIFLEIVLLQNFKCDLKKILFAIITWWALRTRSTSSLAKSTLWPFSSCPLISSGLAKTYNEFHNELNYKILDNI